MKDNEQPVPEHLKIKPEQKLETVSDEEFRKVLKESLIRNKAALDYLKDK